VNAIAIAAKAKGPIRLLQRTSVIFQRYHLNPGSMDQALARFAQILAQYDASATFPITGAPLSRNPGVARKYQSGSIEFAVHGYYHVDHTQLSGEQQHDDLAQARKLFAESGVDNLGFRCPYLRWNEDTITALKAAGYQYDSSQALAWDVLNGSENEAYRRVLGFYAAVSASDSPALPRIENGLVRIPYCLPDDEALVDRLQLQHAPSFYQPWLAVLAETYRLGELFTLGLHPERIALCRAPLEETLRVAQRLSPGVWFARLDDITRWWHARAQAAVVIESANGTDFCIRARGPAGLSILTRGVDLRSPSKNWDGTYRQAAGRNVCFQAASRPFIGLSPGSHPRLERFLQQQGYIVETAEDGLSYAFYIDRQQFDHKDERELLAEIERGPFPLVRFGRWPDGAKSALCITGDIDALTLWDYSLRFLGR
jgi:peptidoglycan/xylan/chitin deacetylase (PgdA/CDA1 family)